MRNVDIVYSLLLKQIEWILLWRKNRNDFECIFKWNNFFNDDILI